MKKLFAILLCALMLAVAGFACAESVSDLYEGEWIQIENGPKLYVPAGWVEYEVTEELAAAGLCYATGSEDGVYTCQIYWSALEQDMEIEELLAMMVELYPEAQLIDLESAAFVCFADLDADALGFAALDATQPGLYQFMFTPATDEDMLLVASAIVASMAE